MNEGKKNWKRIILVTLVLATMVLGGFSVMTNNAAAATPTRADQGSTLIIAFQQDVPNLNYFDPNTNTVWKFDAIGWGWDSLMAYTPDLQPYMNLADSVETDSTGLNVTVHIRQGVTFHDGVELTADDVVFSYEALAYNQLFHSDLDCLIWSSPQFTLWNGTGTSHVGVEKVDQYTVVFHLAYPYPLFYHVTLGLPIIPSHIWKDHTKSAGQPDSDDFILDYSYGKDMSEVDATIGTGPFYVADWQPGSYLVIKRYDNYWGKNFTVNWQGKAWNTYPTNVTEIEFKIYNTLDTAVLALKKGEVHFIDWSVPPGYYNQLKTDPNIGSQVVDDQGFFYLAFNMRKAPENDLAFRQAVAHSIDKDYIVTTLMQGYGTKGTVPISITSGAYVNTSAIPPDFDLNAAKQVLDQAGYVDANGDGWRDAPNGAPIKETILTPPKDYDPIRAEAGIMIQNNLQSIGLNVISNPTDFDTIVSKAFVQVQFDMYILGWGVGSFPELYLYDFFHSSQAAPIGYNTPGYSNPKVDQLLDEIKTEMDTQKRIQEVKDVEGILVHDLPYDTLYYRKNIMCYRKDIWQGWVPAFGTIYNGFSIGSLHHPGAITPPNPHGPSEVTGNYNGAVLHMYVPNYAYAGKGINGLAYVTDFDGVPIKNVTVQIYTSTGFSQNFTTGDSGGVKFHIPLAFQDYKSVTVGYYTSVKIGDKYYNYTGSKDVKVYLPKNAAVLTLSSNTGVVEAGQHANVTAKVTDIMGNPLQGVTVDLITEETAGSVSPGSGVTGADGTVTFTYTAPTLMNTNTVDIVKAAISVNNTILPSTQQATLYLAIQSTGSSWYHVEIENITHFGISAGNSTDINVKVVDQDGNPIANKAVHAEAIYSTATDPNWYGQKGIVDTTNVTFDATTKNTDNNGMVTFTLTAVNNVNKPYYIKVYTDDAYSVYDAAQIYVGNITPLLQKINNYTYTYDNSTGNISWSNHTDWANITVGYDPMVCGWEIPYGMIMHVNTPSAEVGNQVTVTTEVYYAMDVYYAEYNLTYNATSGATENVTLVDYAQVAAADTPAPGVLTFMAVYGTDLGFGADWTGGVGTYVWWAGQSLIGSYTDANGTFAYTLDTKPLMSDEPIYISAWVDFGCGQWAPYTGLGFDLPYDFGAKTGFALIRAPIMGIADMNFEGHYLSDMDAFTTVNFTVVDANGALSNVNVDMTYSIGEYSSEMTATTDANGVVSFQLSVPPQIMDSVITISVLLSSADHAMTYNYEYEIPYLAGVADMENLVVLYNVDINPDPVPNNGSATVTLQYLGGLTAAPMNNMSVELSVPAGTVTQVTANTDANGTVTFTYNAPELLHPVHYVVAAQTEYGTVNYFPIEVLGEYSTTGDVNNKINELNNTVKNQSQQLQDKDNQISNLQSQLDNATMMEYIFLALFIIFLIIAPVMYIVGKKQGGGAAPAEEPAEEEVSEEPEEEAEEEMTEEPAEEAGEEESEE